MLSFFYFVYAPKKYKMLPSDEFLIFYSDSELEIPSMSLDFFYYTYCNFLWN